MKRLHRSRRTKLLGGVAAGFAEYFNTDVTIMRLLFALVAITIPNSVLAYVLAWIIIPEDPNETVVVSPAPQPAPSALPPTAEELLGKKYADDVPQQAPAGTPPSTPPPAPAEPEKNRQLFGYVLIAVGTVVLVKRFVPSFVWRLPGRLIGQAWPVLIIIVGAALIFGAIRGR